MAQPHKLAKKHSKILTPGPGASRVTAGAWYGQRARKGNVRPQGSISSEGACAELNRLRQGNWVPRLKAGHTQCAWSRGEDSRAASALRNTCWAIYCKACNGIQSICSMDEVAASEQGLLGVANSLLTRTTLYTDKRSVRPDKSPRVSGGLFLCVLKLLKAAAALAMECPRSSFFRLKQHGERCKPAPICQLKRPLLALGSEDITSSILRLQCFVASSTVFLRRESGAGSSDTEASEMWASGS